MTVPYLAFLTLALLGPDDFTLSLPVSPETPEGQRLIAERALAICGGRYPQLGRYRFSGTATVDRDRLGEAHFQVHQELACLDAPPPPLIVQPAPADWRPDEEDERQVLALTRHYFALVDAGDAEQAHRLWSESQQAAVPLAERAAQLEAFRRGAGAPGAHRVTALTWYVNPPGAPAPGIYVAADFERSYSGLHLNCGYVVWLRQARGRYVLIREESGSLAKADSDGSPETMEEVRVLLRCPPR